MSAVQQVKVAIARAKQHQTLNLLISMDASGAMARARALDEARAQGQDTGPLHGMPIVVKDNIHLAGVTNTAGTPALEKFVPDATNETLECLLGAGAVVIGKANLHELAFGITSNNAAYGAVGNPIEPTLFAGGSSGGTAAAVAAGVVPAGLGTDTGGSVRIPAALTGVCGFRPSSGRYPTTRVTPISHTRDTVGTIARTVDDLIRLDKVIVPDAPDAPTLNNSEIRLGVPRAYYYAGLDQAIVPVIEHALAQLDAAGFTLVEADFPDLPELIQASAFPIALYEAAHDLPAYLRDYNTGVSMQELAERSASEDVHGIMASLLGDGAMPEEAYQGALKAREALRHGMTGYFQSHELHGMVFPCTALPARPIAGSTQNVELNGKQVPTFPTYIRNTDPASVAALPGVTVPVGKTGAGLPVGLELDGPEKSDTTILAIAARVVSTVGA